MVLKVGLFRNQIQLNNLFLFLASFEFTISISKFSLYPIFLICSLILLSFPTKIGEFLSCNIPLICNQYNNDIKNLISKNNLGLIVDFDKLSSIICISENN